MKRKRMTCPVWLYLSILVAVLLLFPQAGRAQPSNDAFANGQSLGGSTGSATGNNFGATKESGEPNHAGNSGGHSVWYRWTASSSTPVTIDTVGSNFDTLLGVYTGGSVSSLTTIASNDDIGGNNLSSRVSFTPVAGTTYQIAVDGWGGATGTITLNWNQSAQNLPDLIIWGPAASPRIATVTFSSSSCAVVEGMVQAGTRKLLRFSTQTRNQGTADLYLGNPATNPQFVYAPCHGHYHFNNYCTYRLLGSDGQPAATGLKIGFCLLDTIRWSPNAPSSAKYTCGNQGIQKGWGDVYDSSLDGQWIDITDVPDGNYTLEMEVNPQRTLAESNYDNNITRIPITLGSAGPANDNFAAAQGLSGSSASVSGANVNATEETGEPNHAGNAGGHSVWYFWTAPSSRTVTVDTVGSSFNTLLAVYTGSSVSSLTTVASNDDISSTINQSRVAFAPVAGTTYRIAVDGKSGATGNIVFTLNQNPGNDNFANCEFIGGASDSVTGSNVSASKEGGEPNHAGNRGGRSIWYCWTAPNTASVTFDTIGSTFDTLLAVYIGDSVNGLTAVASNDDIDYPGNLQSRVTFNAVATTQYHVAIDGYNGASGNTTLNWNLAGGLFLQVARPTSRSSNEVGDAGERPTLNYNFLAAGEYELVITGQPLRPYSVEVSDDLIQWTSLATTLADSAGTAYFRDKATVQMRRAADGEVGAAGPIKGRIDDPVCGVSGTNALAGTVGSGASRFYRAVEVP